MYLFEQFHSKSTRARSVRHCRRKQWITLADENEFGTHSRTRIAIDDDELTTAARYSPESSLFWFAVLFCPVCAFNVLPSTHQLQGAMWSDTFWIWKKWKKQKCICEKNRHVKSWIDKCVVKTHICTCKVSLKNSNRNCWTNIGIECEKIYKFYIMAAAINMNSEASHNRQKSMSCRLWLLQSDTIDAKKKKYETVG